MALQQWSVPVTRAGWEVLVAQVDSPPHTAPEVRALEWVYHLLPLRPWANADRPHCILRPRWVTRILSKYCWTAARTPMHAIATRRDQLTRQERRVRAGLCGCSKNSKPPGALRLHQHHGTLPPLLSRRPISPRIRLVRLPHCMATPCQQTPTAVRHPLDVIRYLNHDLLSLRFTNLLRRPQSPPSEPKHRASSPSGDLGQPGRLRRTRAAILRQTRPVLLALEGFSRKRPLRIRDHPLPRLLSNLPFKCPYKRTMSGNRRHITCTQCRHMQGPRSGRPSRGVCTTTTSLSSTTRTHHIYPLRISQHRWPM